MPRMYVYENEIRIRGIMDNSLFLDLTDMLAREFGEVFDRQATLFSVSDSGNIFGRWCFLCHGAETEAADFIADHFDIINHKGLVVRFCIPYCGKEIWTAGEASESDSPSSGAGSRFAEFEKKVLDSMRGCTG
ncbi:hypothetical protein EXO80_13070 [Salmonella enterica]|nr:hypothetical protein [Salmonella enterica]ECH1725495.1 hypothetical protein [Salmonella enterica]